MPKHGEYDWSGGPATLDDHSLAKHKLLDPNVYDYVRPLAQNPRRQELNLTVVDGFAGGGLYRGVHGEEHLSSPLLVMHAVETTTAAESARRREGLSVRTQYIFVEKNRTAIEFLKRTLAERGLGPNASRTVEILGGTFEKHAAPILEAARTHSPKSHRTIFVLDQDGWRQLPTAMIAQIFQTFERPEVILTFSVDKFANTLADTAELREAIRRWDPDIEFDLWLRSRLDGGVDWRADAQHLLHQHFANASGARFFHPFYIASSNSNLSYLLIHLSKQARAHDVPEIIRRGRARPRGRRRTHLVATPAAFGQ